MKGLGGMAALAAAVLALGCGDLFPADPTVEVSLTLEGSVASSYGLSASIGGRRVELSADPQSTSRVTARVLGTDAVPVRLIVRSVAGDSVAGFGFDQKFERGSDHWIAVFIGREPPLSSCANGFNLPRMATTGGDSAYVSAGSLPKGAMC